MYGSPGRSVCRAERICAGVAGRQPTAPGVQGMIGPLRPVEKVKVLRVVTNTQVPARVCFGVIDSRVVSSTTSVRATAAS